MSAAMASGPYWLNTAPNGERQVCGRHGKIMFRYPSNMDAAAIEHVRRLQAGYTAEQKRIRDAAPDLLEALERILASGHAIPQSLRWDAEAAIAKARGSDQ